MLLIITQDADTLAALRAADIEFRNVPATRDVASALHAIGAPGAVLAYGPDALADLDTVALPSTLDTSAIVVTGPDDIPSWVWPRAVALGCSHVIALPVGGEFLRTQIATLRADAAAVQG